MSTTSDLYSDMPGNTYDPANMGYFMSPQPTDYNQVYGGIPGQLAVPPSVYQEMGQSVPGFTQNTGAAGGDISSMLAGQLSPGTMMNIGNYAASRGVALGEPNSAISNEIGLSTTGTTSEQLMQSGLGYYNQMAGTLGSEQTNPSLVAGLEMQNATDLAAPDPYSAGLHETWLFDQGLDAGHNLQEEELIGLGLSSLGDMGSSIGGGLAGK
jgi:hypothetical protein